MKKSKSIPFLAMAVACGIQPAFANEPEDILNPAPAPTVLKLPAPPPPLDQIIPAPPPLVEDILLAPPRLVQHIKDHVVHLLAQAAPAPAASPAAPVRAGKPRPPEVPGPFGYAVSGSTRASRSLVIPKDDMDAQAMAAAEEDLNVMAVILNKAVDEKPDDDRKVMGIDIFGGLGSAGARNLLIEGHGAIFLLKTKLSLTPPPDRKEESKSKEPTNSEWEDARRRLYGTAEWEREIHKSMKHFPGGSALPYDENNVNELKNDVIDSLKNATNIRGLKGDNLVTVVINGPAVEGEWQTGFGFAGRLEGIVRHAKGEHRFEHEEHGSEGRRGSRIMIQAKKSDIDDFAKNGNKEAFRKKVKVRTY